MTFDKIIMYVMAVGILIGACDKIIGNKFGLGEKFEEGLNTMGTLAIGMAGIICLAPVISDVIGPVIAPMCSMVSIDPAMFGSILACDMGGYPLAMNLAQSEEIGLFSGILIASMLGCTVSFTIPVGLGLIDQKDQPYFAQGLLIGLITIPIGGVLGSIAAGFDIKLVLINTIPVLIISILLAIGLKCIPDAMIKGCIYFGRLIEIVILIGLALAGFESLTGIVILKGMAPISEAMGIVGSIAVVLMGILPVLTLFLKLLDKPLQSLGKKVGLDTSSTAALIITLANAVPVFVMLKEMSPKGKVVNVAFIVSASCVFGDHLGFTAGVEQSMITPLIVGKLAAGITAVILAFVMTKNLEGAEQNK